MYAHGFKVLNVSSPQVCLEMEEHCLHVCVVSGEGLMMVETDDTLSLPSPYVVTRLQTPE